jgi:septum formation protein
MEDRKRIILASSSPRRRELLGKLLGDDFEVEPPEVEDDDPYSWGYSASTSCVGEMVKDLSLKKARDVASKVGKGAIVIGGDTIVYCDGRILGKPSSPEDALNMLRVLSGKEHLVISGIAVVDTDSGGEIADYVVTRVKFRDISEEEMEEYVASGEPMDKAGAYAIQGMASKFVEAIEGSYSNVVGLPTERLSEILRRYGLLTRDPM